jgi:hypothetical protein
MRVESWPIPDTDPMKHIATAPNVDDGIEYESVSYKRSF